MKLVNTRILAISVLIISGALFAANSHAQTIGWIGVGDFNYGVEGGSANPETNAAIQAFGYNTTATLAKTRKFNLLDNSQLKQRLQQRGVSLQGYYDKTNPAEDYEQAGLDYILTGDITEMGVFKRKRGSSTQAVGLVDLDIRVISVSHGTKDYNASISAQSAGQLGDGVTEQSILDEALDEAVDQMVANIMAGLFPIRIMKVSEQGALTLNYGNGVLKAGDTIRMFSKPEGNAGSTNEAGDPIATVQVISTDVKFSTAQALDGGDALERGVQGELLLTGG